MGQILSEQQRYLSMATDMPDRTVSVRSGSVTYPYGRFSDRSMLVPKLEVPFQAVIEPLKSKKALN